MRRVDIYQDADGKYYEISFSVHGKNFIQTEISAKEYWNISRV